MQAPQTHFDDARAATAKRIAHIRRLVGLLTLAAVVSGVAGPVCAQDYPVKPVRSIVGFPPGGAVDFNARLIAQKLGDLWSQPVVIENKGGAGSTIGAAAAAAAPADGYTYLVVSPAHTINATMYRKLPFDTETAFTAVTQLVSSPLAVYLNPNVPANSIKELVALARDKPGKLNFGFGGNGTSVHLASVLFNILGGTDIVYIPFQGGGPTLSATLAGTVDIMIGGIEYMNTQARAGKLKAIAVTTPRRARAFPDVPTVTESGLPGYEVETWYGIYVPAKTPANIVRKLNQDIVKVLQQPDLQETYAKQGFSVVGSTPEQFAAFTRAEIDKWRRVVTAANLTAD